MNDPESEEKAKGLVFSYTLDAPPEKVWRAITIPEYREKWLPGKDVADAEPDISEPDGEIRFHMREHEPPFLKSAVTFRVRPHRNGGTILRIIHELTGARAGRSIPQAANSNGPSLMLAA
ncbi:SRPBCC family protein [Hoeflea poritis]|uniref:SRPBCC domain-containing protein n=1 Tax=Hoeflea poritis TaxID=2993659 RepID=A0ABT4VJ93_9HYPH|nr:SRPBCC domain-containing protein [Hoeflea poritis]MDA4844789.1 SRPBCC domain-containing protein [Hoeflea poritis]